MGCMKRPWAVSVRQDRPKQSRGLATIFTYKFQVIIFQSVHIVTKTSICYEASMGRLDDSDSELIIYYIWFIHCLQFLYVDLHFVYVDKSLQYVLKNVTFRNTV
jgi:hypothetical protein